MLLGLAVVIAVIAIAAVAVGRPPSRDGAIARIPWFPVAELPTRTLARVVGRVQALHRPMLAPLAKCPCVYYRLRVYRNHCLVIDIDDCVTFTVDDGTGAVIVDARRGSIGVRQRTERRTPLGPNEQALLQRFAIPQDAEFVLVESVLPVGHQVAVIGSGIRDYRTQISFEKRHDAELVVTDDPRAFVT